MGYDFTFKALSLKRITHEFSMLKYKDNIRETRLRIIKYRKERERDSVKTMKYMFLSITMYFYVGLCINILPTIKGTAL
jgi:hypothetical protein